MNSNSSFIPASTLPIYDRAVSRFPHLSDIPDAKTFCRQLSYLEAVDTITAAEYTAIARVAEGEPWPD